MPPDYDNPSIRDLSSLTHSAQMHELSVAVAVMVEQSKQSKEAISKLNRTIEAMEGRQSEIITVIHDLKRDMVRHIKDIDDMQSFVDDYKKMKQRGIGIVMLLSFALVGVLEGVKFFFKTH